MLAMFTTTAMAVLSLTPPYQLLPSIKVTSQQPTCANMISSKLGCRGVTASGLRFAVCSLLNGVGPRSEKATNQVSVPCVQSRWPQCFHSKMATGGELMIVLWLGSHPNRPMMGLFTPYPQGSRRCEPVRLAFLSRDISQSWPYGQHINRQLILLSHAKCRTLVFLEPPARCIRTRTAYTGRL